MSTDKDSEIKFGLHSFEILDFELNSEVTLFDEEESGYSIQFRLGVSEEESTVSCFLLVTAQEGPDADTFIAKIDTKTTFTVHDMDKIKRSDSIELPKNLGTTLLSISLSTTRGALAAKSEGHVINRHLLPLLDPRKMYDDFLAQESKRRK
ncbi:MAG: hypothetical protein ACQER4_03890 [Bacteroidota bacterium]